MDRAMIRSRQLDEQARELIPGGMNSPMKAFHKVGDSPVYFREDTGSRCTDADGNHYAGFCPWRVVERLNRLCWPMLYSGFYLPPSAHEVFILSSSHTEDDVDQPAYALAQKLSEDEIP